MWHSVTILFCLHWLIKGLASPNLLIQSHGEHKSDFCVTWLLVRIWKCYMLSSLTANAQSFRKVMERPCHTFLTDNDCSLFILFCSSRSKKSSYNGVRRYKLNFEHFLETSFNIDALWTHSENFYRKLPGHLLHQVLILLVYFFFSSTLGIKDMSYQRTI